MSRFRIEHLDQTIISQAVEIETLKAEVEYQYSEKEKWRDLYYEMVEKYETPYQPIGERPCTEVQSC